MISDTQVTPSLIVPRVHPQQSIDLADPQVKNDEDSKDISSAKKRDATAA